MDDIAAHIQRLATLFAQTMNRSESTVSRLCTGSGATLMRLKNGRPITTHRAYRAIQWFSDHWPDGEVGWPADIPRPDRQRDAA